MSDHLVTVVMPVKDTPYDYLESSIKSVVNQTAYDFIKFVVVDDGSNAVTKSILKELAGLYKFDLVRNLVSRSPAICRNKGLDRAKNLYNTPYFAIIDSDDVWQPRKIERQLNSIQTGIDGKFYGVCLTGTEIYLSEYHTSVFTPADLIQELTHPIDDTGLFTPNGSYPRLLRFNASFCGSNALFRTDVLSGFEPKYYGADEWDALLAVVEHYPLSVVTSHEVIYRRHPFSLSHIKKPRIIKSVETILYHRRLQSSSANLLSYGSVPVAIWANALSKATEYAYIEGRIPVYYG